MSTAAERSEIAVLQTQMKEVQTNIADLKNDIKDIKTILLTTSSNLVTREEMEQFKRSVKVNYFLIVLGTAIVTSMAYALIQGRLK